MGFKRRLTNPKFREEEELNSEMVSREELLKRLTKSEEAKVEKELERINNKFYRNLPFLQKLSAKKCLMIDIGTDKIFYIVARRSSKSIQVKNWGEEDLSVEEFDRYRSLEIALKYIRSHIYKPGMSVRISFFSPDINIRQVVLPKLKTPDLEKTILYKNKSELPYFDENTVWNYQILETFTEDNIQKVRVLVTVVPNEILDIYLDIFQKVGLKPDCLIPRPFALFGVYLHMVGSIQNDVIIDIGNDVTQICFVVDRKLRFVRNFAIGANNLQKAISNGNIKEVDLKLDITDSQNTRENIRDRLLQKVQIFKSNQNPLLQVLLSEILRSLEFFQGKNSQYPINNIYITGAGLKIKSVFHYLKNRIHYPVNMLVPQFSQNSTFPAECTEYVGALGTGLINVKEVNLIPSEYRKRELFKNLNILLTVLLIMFSSTATYYTIQLKEKVNHYFQLIENTREHYLELNPIEKRYQEIIKQINLLNKETNRLISIVKPVDELLQVLKLFSNEVPPDIRLTSIEFNKYHQKITSKRESQNLTNSEMNTPKYQVRITGRIFGDYLMGDIKLIDFINRLNELHFFKSVQIVTKRKNPQDSFLEFELETLL